MVLLLPPDAEVISRLAALTPLASESPPDPSSPSYDGPCAYSNWLIPEKVLMGAFPCREVFRREGPGGHLVALDALISAGVTLFAALDASDDLCDVCLSPPRIRRSPLYESQLRSRPAWSGECRVWATEDGGAFEWEVLEECLTALHAHLCAGRGVAYIHCFGGHGRAGVVSACLLGLAFALPADAALELTQRAHDSRADAAWPCDTRQRSPQTDVQREQVHILLTALRAERAVANG